MPTIYLFRVDGAKDNDDYFGAIRGSASHVYAGMDFHVGRIGCWVPDLVSLEVEDSARKCILTLIELEATEPAALISCRKYLPESSVAVMNDFVGYVDRVVAQCRRRADSREVEFAKLKDFLSQHPHFTVRTAAALRSSTALVEDLPLIDQPKLEEQPQSRQRSPGNEPRVFRGVLVLSAIEAKALGRSVMILDAVVRHRDHSGAVLHSWRSKAPLKRLLAANGGRRSALHNLIFGGQYGITFDFEKLLSDVSDVWSDACGSKLNLEGIRALVSSYFPVALPLHKHNQMSEIFEAARKHVAETGHLNRTK